MAQDASSIHQFRALAAVERALRDDPALAGPALARMREALDPSAATVVGVERITEGDDASSDPMEHLREHWLSGAYFPNIPADTIAARLQDGFREAVLASQTTGKPLVPVWVCATEDSKASVFRVDHVVTETTVVLAIVTPRPASSR
jgi:hypothetical protein